SCIKAEYPTMAKAGSKAKRAMEGLPSEFAVPRSRAKCICRVGIFLCIPHNGKLGTSIDIENNVALRATPVKVRLRSRCLAKRPQRHPVALGSQDRRRDQHLRSRRGGMCRRGVAG